MIPTSNLRNVSGVMRIRFVMALAVLVVVPPFASAEHLALTTFDVRADIAVLVRASFGGADDKSSDGALRRVEWGAPGDVPVPGRY